MRNIGSHGGKYVRGCDTVHFGKRECAAPMFMVEDHGTRHRRLVPPNAGIQSSSSKYWYPV
jgi:hypothetical protein